MGLCRAPWFVIPGLACACITRKSLVTSCIAPPEHQNNKRRPCARKKGCLRQPASECSPFFHIPRNEPRAHTSQSHEPPPSLFSLQLYIYPIVQFSPGCPRTCTVFLSPAFASPSSSTSPRRFRSPPLHARHANLRCACCLAPPPLVFAVEPGCLLCPLWSPSARYFAPPASINALEDPL